MGKYKLTTVSANVLAAVSLTLTSESPMNLRRTLINVSWNEMLIKFIPKKLVF